ncbi:hypothetical protein C2G38_2227926 [Gigaspora rosea]|uniref:Uncharacterized protein n=1 Tax=Gigaspora rosea TaxID=44941 RepID=A0A397TZP7_9GLOM|nr:hypothetical protein C2G38_2227926 [Gigaspora rosea]
MPLHIYLIILNVEKYDKISHTQGLVKYQSDKDFFNLNFVIEEENEYIMVAHAKINDIGNSNNRFEAEEIPFSMKT